MFAKHAGPAQKAYSQFISKGIPKGRQLNLVGGGKDPLAGEIESRLFDC
jgi:hypothetical protein